MKTRSSISRSGFTLLEILVAITIMAILIALLVPVVGGAKETALRAEVRAEISRLEQALTDFRAKFGMYPPSGIVLSERGILAASPGDPGWQPASVPFIRAMWPEFDFTLDRDFDGDGNLTESFPLDCRECLVFFLGGPGALVPDDTGTADIEGPLLTGFSNNLSNPFDLAGSNRVGPFFEFDVARIRDFEAAGDGIPEYSDPFPGQTMPYLYLSSYDGSGYRPLGLNGVFDSGTGDDELPAGITSFEGYWQAGTGASRSWWKNKSFQIISPGRDALYGSGGVYTEDGAETQLVGTTRFPERDNITNFAGGTLAAQ